MIIFADTKHQGMIGIDWRMTFFELIQAVLALEALKSPKHNVNGENPFFALAGLVPAEHAQVAVAA